MVIIEIVRGRLDEFKNLCVGHNVKKLYAFGSSVTNHFDIRTSDIDLLVEIDDDDPMVRGEHLLDLWDKFEEYFQRRVDLLTNTSIKNPVLRNNIEKSKVLIYDGTREKVLI